VTVAAAETAMAAGKAMRESRQQTTARTPAVGVFRLCSSAGRLRFAQPRSEATAAAAAAHRQTVGTQSSSSKGSSGGSSRGSSRGSSSSGSGRGSKKGTGADGKEQQR
jgi:hypothetical protein